MEKRRSSTIRFLLTIIFIFFVAALCPMRFTAGQEKKPSLSKYEKVEAAVWRWFQSQSDFYSSKLITREQVEPLFSDLARKGLNVPDTKSIVDKLPAKSEFMVAELYSPPGLKFMRQISRYPRAYDRLDRLIRLPHGRQTVHDLIRGPGGEKMIQYLTTDQGGIEMGKMLSNAPRGADFNRPTGRIYTVPMLLKHLQAQYPAVDKISTEKNK